MVILQETKRYGVRELFELGIKPSWLVNYKTRKKNEQGVIEATGTTQIFNELSKEYPYIIFEHRNNVLFFNDELTKEWFEVNGCICAYSKKLGKWIQDYKAEVLGLTLGFPPMAVKYFIEWNKITDRELLENDRRIGIDYYGIRFVTHESLVDECLDWLKRNRPVPDYMESSRGIEIDRGRLKQVK